MNDITHEPSRVSLWLTVVAVVAGFLLFAAVLFIWYLPERNTSGVVTPSFSKAEMDELAKLEPLEREARLREMRWERRIPTPADRTERLQELHAQENAALRNYSWIDQSAGTVRLPIDRAMELTLQDLQQGRNR